MKDLVDRLTRAQKEQWSLYDMIVACPSDPGARALFDGVTEEIDGLRREIRLTARERLKELKHETE